MSRQLEPQSRVHVAGSFAAAISLIVMLLTATVGLAQEPNDDADSAGNSASAVQEPVSLSSITARIKALEQERADLTKAAVAPAAAALSQPRLEKLDRIGRILAMQATLATELSTPDKAVEASLTADAASIFRLNSLYEDLETARKNIDDRGANLAAAREKLDTRKKELSALKIEEGVLPGKKTANESEALVVARYAARAAQEEVYLATLEAREASAVVGGVDILTQAIDDLRLELKGNPTGAADALERLELSISKLEQQDASAKSSIELADLRLAAAQKQLSSAATDSQGILVRVKALSSLRDVYRERLSLLAAERERLEGQKEIWRHWSELLEASPSSESLHDWQKQAEKRLATLRLDETQALNRAADLKNRIDLVDTKLLESDLHPQLAALYREMATPLDSLHSDQLNALRGLGFDQRLTQRLLDDIHKEIGNFNLLDWAAKTTGSIVQIWNYEIATIDDAPFTLGSLTIGLTLFGAGVWISRRVSAGVGRIASNRFRLDPGASHAIETLSFYIMLLAIGLLALRTIHFPLTAFAFLGGALAIGIGFGSQNVMNNFISGLILMLERPVRAADVVEVDGNHGTIERIGARSTQIRSNDGRHIVVPNSFFLESNVINWTLSDDLIRAKVAVGVAYGSPTELVDKLINEVVGQHKEVLQNPKPIIIFESFGDNSLNFEAHFWVSARSPMAVRQIESKIRFAIDRVFREHDVVIAFPQRDVHLDSLSPLEVRMVKSSEDKPREI